MAFRYSGDGWRVAHAIRTFGDQIMALRGHTDSYPVDGTLGDVAHSNRVSDHNPDENGIVRALDFYEHKPGFVDEVFEAMRLARDSRLKYAIHDKRMFASYSTTARKAWEWGEYTGPNGHVTHGHLSVLPTGDNDSRPFQLIEEDDMPLTGDDIRRIWEYAVPDEDDGLGTRGAVHALRQAWGYARKASIDAAVARRIAETSAGSSAPLTAAQIDAIADAVADEFAERLVG